MTIEEIELSFRSAAPIRQKSNFVYLIGAPNGLIKIGITGDVYRRLKVLDTASPVELNLIFSFESDNANIIELELHQIFAIKRIKGEWFNLSTDDIKWIKGKYGR